jgi:hypothetical protein
MRTNLDIDFTNVQDDYSNKLSKHLSQTATTTVSTSNSFVDLTGEGKGDISTVVNKTTSVLSNEELNESDMIVKDMHKCMLK